MKQIYISFPRNPLQEFITTGRILNIFSSKLQKYVRRTDSQAFELYDQLQK